MLEEDVAVFCGAAENGVLGVECTGAECLECIHINHLSEILVVPSLDLLNLVRGTEAVEEVEEGNAALDRCKVSNCAEVHDLLLVGLCHHSEAGLTASVNVGVIAEDVERVRSYATSRNMDDAGKKLACDLIHVGDHQKQTLRSGVGGGECTCCERAVNGTCRTCLGLHLHHLNGVAENVSRGFTEDVLVGSSPCVGHFRHRRRRRDRVDGSNLGERVGHVRRGGVTIHGNLFSFNSHVCVILLRFIEDKLSLPTYMIPHFLRNVKTFFKISERLHVKFLSSLPFYIKNEAF